LKSEGKNLSPARDQRNTAAIGAAIVTIKLKTPKESFVAYRKSEIVVKAGIKRMMNIGIANTRNPILSCRT
jgi:hypothetical protein